MTARAKRNEILFGIIPQLGARAEVVDLKILGFPQSWQRHPLRASTSRMSWR